MLVVRPAGRRAVISARWLLALPAVWLGLSATAMAQDTEKVADPEVIGLTTSDGLNLTATYYPGPEGKNTVPVVMLHGLGGTRADLHDLALALQAAGHSVLVPDLRGHGDSPIVTDAGVTLTPDRLTRPHFIGMVADVEACKSHLMGLNNEGSLNIDKLCVVGSDLGAIVALHWSAGDWAVPDLPGRRQSRWVKALVLISPAWSVKGFSVSPALQSPAIQENIALYIVSGQESKDTTRLARQFEGYRSNLKPSNLAVREFETTLQGAALTTAPNLDVAARIGQFINLQLVEKTFPWKDHTR